MKQLMRKLKSKAGESLVESLAAILIFTMASIVLFSMVNAAGDINTTAKEQDRLNQEQMIAVEKGEEAYKNGQGKIIMTITKSDNTQETIAAVDVDIYGGEDGGLYSFFVTTPAGG